VNGPVGNADTDTGQFNIEGLDMDSNSVARERRFKDQAERLREFLAAAGVDLKHTTSLQALAHMHKAQDWRALLASSLQPEAAHSPAPSRFLTLTMTSDSGDRSYGLRRIAVRVDQIANFTDVSADKHILSPNTCIHLVEPADWETDGSADDEEEASGVVRAYRQIYVRETFDEIASLLNIGARVAEGRKHDGSA